MVSKHSYVKSTCFPGGGVWVRRRGGGEGREREEASREALVFRKACKIKDCSMDYLFKTCLLSFGFSGSSLLHVGFL